jgi:hypothetical protein
MLATVRRGCKGSSRLRGSDGDVSLGLDMWMCNVDGDGHGGRDVASVQAWGVSQLCEGSAHAGSGVELDANRWLGAWWWRRLTRARWLHGSMPTSMSTLRLPAFAAEVHASSRAGPVHVP